MSVYLSEDDRLAVIEARRDGDLNSFILVHNNQRWRLTMAHEEPFDLVLHAEHLGVSWHLTEQPGEFRFLGNEGTAR